MNKIFFTGVFLVTILKTVFPNKNVSKELQNSNLTANKNGTSINNNTKGEIRNDYVDPELQKVWKKYLAEAVVTEFNPSLVRQMKSTTAMRKDSAVIKTIKPFRERGKQQEQKVIEREAKTIINVAPKPGAKTFGIGNDRTVNHSRRAGGRLYEQKNPFAAAIELQSQFDDRQKFESYRQPYWKEGDEVYLRTGSPSTPGPRELEMEIFRSCDRTCNYYFKTYGKVCGHRYNMKKFINEYKNFDNICDIDHENCYQLKINWHPMHRGNCTQLEEFKEVEFDDWNQITERMKKWAPYSLTDPTPTPEPPPDRETFPTFPGGYLQLRH